MGKFFLMLALLPGLLAAQQVGAVKLQIGELRDSALARLSAFYSLDSLVSGLDAFTIHDRNAAHGELGTVMFQGGRLTDVARSYGVGRTDGREEVALAVIRAFAALESDGPCYSVHYGNNVSGASSESIDINCRSGAHVARVNVIRAPGVSAVIGVSESWHRAK